MICGKDISLCYKSKAILDNVSFEVPNKRITTFIGKSGAGKTSLLKCIANLEKNYSGSIEIQGKKIRELSNEQRAESVGFVFQQFNLFNNLSIIENCIQPQEVVMKRSKEVAKQKAIEILSILGMQDFVNEFPSKLSGGQQQRVAIARALCLEPKILLLDEPTSALDPENTKNLVFILKQLCKTGISIAVSSQDMSFVKEILDRVYFMENGKIVECFDLKTTDSNKISLRIKNFIA